MGLLTGFSIISGVEILYFSLKLLMKRSQEKLKKIKLNIEICKCFGDLCSKTNYICVYFKTN